MSVSASDLSDPHYGFDLVVAVTQASVNTTMKQLMAGLNAPEVTWASSGSRTRSRAASPARSKAWRGRSIRASPATLATVACVGNIAYVSPNIATLIDAKTDNWYSELNNVLTGISILKGMIGIPAAAYNKPIVGKVFAFVENFINVVWNIPVIANIIVNKDVWNTTYKSLFPESIGNFAFNVGGILEFPIAVVKDPKAKVILIVIQAALMVAYGRFMIIAGGIYEFGKDQQH